MTIQMISDQEIKSLAKSANIALEPHQITMLTGQVAQVLNYAQCVCKHNNSIQFALFKNSNIFRDDAIAQSNSEELIERAPQSEGSYFVVPLMLDNR